MEAYRGGGYVRNGFYEYVKHYDSVFIARHRYYSTSGAIIGSIRYIYLPKVFYIYPIS